MKAKIKKTPQIKTIYEKPYLKLFHYYFKKIKTYGTKPHEWPQFELIKKIVNYSIWSLHVSYYKVCVVKGTIFIHIKFLT